jgi:hypothetical protein
MRKFLDILRAILGEKLSNFLIFMFALLPGAILLSGFSLLIVSAYSEKKVVLGFYIEVAAVSFLAGLLVGMASLHFKKITTYDRELLIEALIGFFAFFLIFILIHGSAGLAMRFAEWVKPPESILLDENPFFSLGTEALYALLAYQIGFWSGYGLRRIAPIRRKIEQWGQPRQAG